MLVDDASTLLQKTKQCQEFDLKTSNAVNALKQGRYFLILCGEVQWCNDGAAVKVP